MQNATVYIFPKNKEMNLILCRDFSIKSAIQV